MSPSRRFVLLTRSEDLSRIQSLADALASECREQSLNWQVIVSTSMAARGQRKALFVSDSRQQRSQLRKWVKRNDRIPVCALVLDGQSADMGDVTSFDVSQWPGRDADSALDDLLRWLSRADEELLVVPEAPTRVGVRRLIGALLALGLVSLAWSVRETTSHSNPAGFVADRVPQSPDDFSRIGPDGNVAYETQLASRAIYLGLASRQWQQADKLMEIAIWQDPDDPEVAGTAARYFLVRGEFQRAQELLAAHESELRSRDANLLERLRKPNRDRTEIHPASEAQANSNPLRAWCHQARIDPEAAFQSARRLVAAGHLTRAKLLDNLCVLQQIHTGGDDRLLSLLGLTELPAP